MDSERAGAPAQHAAGNLTLSLFQGHHFDCHRLIRSRSPCLNEQGVQTLHLNLLKLKEYSIEEMRLNAFTNYDALIRTLQRIAGLEGCLTSMQSLLLSRSAVVHSLMNCSPLSSGVEPRSQRWLKELEEPSFQRFFHKIIDQLDVHLIDQKVQEAMKVLQQGEDLLYEARLKDNPSQMVKIFQENLVERRSRLVNQLVGTIKKISVHGDEVHTAIAALNQLGEGVMGLDLLLDLYRKRIKAGVKNLDPRGTLFGGLYTAGLSQSVFSGIHEAVKNTLALFGDSAEVASKLILWAYKETGDFVALLKKHVLLATYGLKATVECVRIAYGHCLLVESLGLTLCPYLSQALRPAILCILERSLEHIQETVLFLAAADYWSLKPDSHFEAVSPRKISQKILCRSRGNRKMVFFESPEKLSSSAYYLNMLAMKFAEDSAPLTKIHLEGVVLGHLASLFNYYMQLLLKSLTASCVKRNTVRGHIFLQDAERLEQQIAILVNATALVKDCFPCAACMALTDMTGSKEPLLKNGDVTQVSVVYRPRLQRAFANIQNRFSEIQTEKFLKEFSSVLNSDVYTNFRWSSGKSITCLEEWRPSTFFEV